MRVSPEIESLIPYKPGKPIAETKREFGLAEVTKLASNENPLGPSPMAVQAITKEIGNLGRYPDPTCYELRNKVSQKWDLPSENVLIGNGSNELIDLLIRVFCEPGDRVLMPEKTFIAYGICSQAARVGKKQFPLDKNLELDVEQIVDYVNKKKTSKDKILFLANPNNPTGTYLNKEKTKALVDALADRDDILLVFDEAYDEFVRAKDFPDSYSYMKKHKNILLLKTFSKVFGLAGLRVGALLGDKQHLQWIHRVRNPFNVNSLAQAAACAALDDDEYLKKSRELVWKGLDQFYEFFDQLGLPYYPSQANFVLFDSLRDGQEVFQSLMKKGLLLRPLKGYGLPTELRLTIGSEAENTRAMEIMREVLPKIEVIK